MSDPDPKSAGGGEPSMEDILASIRRILAEDGASAEDEDPGETEPEEPEDNDAVAAAPAADEPPPSPLPAEAAAMRSATPEVPPVDETEAIRPLKPQPQPFDEDIFAKAFSRQDDEGEVFVLTPDMRLEGSIGGERVVSKRTAATGTDVLAQLASAILDRRDIAVSTREVTLEGMVREMLRPLLREWLDRNLPYLIERLVKREIDLMINRAERLED
jgi:Uncharacterized protein conserved in bacteria